MSAPTLAVDGADLDTGAVAPPKRGRLDSVDLLRGLIMVLMVIDHTREFFYTAEFDPTNPQLTTPALFWTRWVTHFCAPVFVFLAGTGAYLARGRFQTNAQLARFLLTRGAFLIVIEFTVSRLGMTFNPFAPLIVAVVLWAIGWSMIILAGLVFLPTPVVGALGVLVIAGHNLLDGWQPASEGALQALWKVLHVQAPVFLPGGVTFFVAYPLVPWCGVMAAGYALGPCMRLPVERRRPILLALGLALSLGFVALRYSNLYGDPRLWSQQRSPLYTLFSFLNTTKYPPSLLFLMMTLGPALVLLAFLDRPAGWLGRVLVTFGRVPLFFYLVHFAFLHALAVLFALALDRPVAWLFSGVTLSAPKGAGFSLAVVYVVWLVVLAILFYPCKWFAALKRRRPGGLLSYF